jgi:hypothetical protein
VVRADAVIQEPSRKTVDSRGLRSVSGCGAGMSDERLEESIELRYFDQRRCRLRAFGLCSFRPGELRRSTAPSSSDARRRSGPRERCRPDAQGRCRPRKFGDFIQAAKDYEEAAKHFEAAAARYEQQLAACAKASTPSASASTSASTPSKRPIEKPAREASTVAPSIIDVHQGDTFSGIAATIIGDGRKWCDLYDPQNSRLANPDLDLCRFAFQIGSCSQRAAILAPYGAGGRIGGGRCSASRQACVVEERDAAVEFTKE